MRQVWQVDMQKQIWLVSFMLADTMAKIVVAPGTLRLRRVVNLCCSFFWILFFVAIRFLVVQKAIAIMQQKGFLETM